MSWQGQSLATIDKERGIASALAINMKIAARVIGRNGNQFTYWHLDTNAGSGWNAEVDVAGSPIMFHKMADSYLTGIRREAWFCDIDQLAIEKLLSELGSWNRDSYLFQRDNEEVLELFAYRLSHCGENPSHVMGSILVDPNGWFYRNKKGEGAPINRLSWFTARFPKIDIILNLNARSRRTMLAHDWYDNDVSPYDVLGQLNKKFWQIKRVRYKGKGSKGGDDYMLAIGRNFKTNAHKKVGFHDLESPQGKEWMLMFEGDRQPKLNLDGDDDGETVRGL